MQPEDAWGPTHEDRLWAALDYLFTPIVPVIVLLVADKRQRPFLRSHNGQALAIGVIQIGLLVLSFLVGCLTTVPDGLAGGHPDRLRGPGLSGQRVHPPAGWRRGRPLSRTGART